MRDNLRARLSASCAAWALMTWCIAANAGAAPLRIMPLGDSITMGYGVGGGYRTQLYSNLLNAGYSFTFVGLNNENPSPVLTAADQAFHNGYGGFRINHIMSGVTGDADYLAADPDLILLLIGTNDFSQNYDTLHAIDRLDALLTAITSRRPNARVIVANLLIRWDTPTENRIQEQFNPFVPGLVATHASRGEKVFFLDLHSAISFYDILDGTHPSRSGYNKLGNVWFQAIQAALAAPTNNPPAGPVARVLTVNSVNPTNGVAITLSPNDTNNLGNGTTAFTRSYTNAAVLTLTAPALAGSNTFVKWQKDGVDLSTGVTVTVTMDTNHTLTAHYASPVVVGGGGNGALVSLAFDEGSGATLVNVGSAGGTFTMTAVSPSWTTLAPPAVGHGSALDFGYTQGNFALDSDAVLPALGGLSQFTITLWLNTRSPVQGQGGNRLVSWTDNGGAGVDLAYLGDGSLHLGVNREADFVARSSSVIPESFEVPVNNWRFCAVTYDAGIGEVRFYFGTPTADASLDKAVMYNQGAVGVNVGRLTVGHSNPATRSAQLKRVFRGLLDQVQIHGRVLSASEIVALQRGTGGGVINPPAGPVARVLTVNSVNPTNGVAITLSPNDTNNLGNGTTAFTRSYTNAAVLTLTAPALAGSNTFVKWQKDGVDLSTGVTVTVTMDTNHTLTAHYASPVVVGGGGNGALVSLAFDEGSGATLVNVGSAGGTFTMTAVSPSWTTLAPPAVGHGSALDFGYTQGNFALDSDAVLPALGGLSQFTITLWLNTRSPVQGQGGNRLVSWTDNGGAGVDLAYLGDGSLHLGVNREADFVARSSSVIPESFEVPVNNWRFCAVTYDAGIGEVRFYFGTPTADASLDKAVMYNQGPVGANVGRLTVGHSNPATRSAQIKRVFRGLLDQVQIHGRVLSASEIVALQRGTSAPPLAPVNEAASLVPVRLVGVTMLVDGRAQVNISGAPNRTYPILGSVDLQNWSVLSEQETDANGALEFIDETAAETPVRFYRAVGM